MNQIVLAFITGLTTGGLSCLAVQGGLLASSIANEVEQSVQRVKTGTVQQTLQPQAARPIALFLAAKVVAYTILGFFLGMLGAVLQLTPTMRAILLAAIGIFMVGTALRMLNIHPIFRYFALQPPSFVTRFIRRKSKDQASALTPLFLGLLTVFIPCGVTQAMMAVAMGTGDPVTGATIMLSFTLGTTPVFFAVAYLTTRLGTRLEKNFLRIVAAIVLFLGLISVDSGLTLAGFPYSVSNLRMAAAASNTATPPVAAAPQRVAQAAALSPSPTVPRPATTTAPTPAVTPATKPTQNIANTPGDQTKTNGPEAPAISTVTITVANNGYSPATSHARANQPIKLALVTNKTSSCARAFVLQSLKIQKLLPETGTVTVDIPAQKPGSKLYYSCSMGMYSGVIVFDG